MEQPKKCHLQEHQKFKQFTDSLLSRSSKVTDLIGQLEDALAESGKGDESSDAQRVKKSNTQLPHVHLKLDVSQIVVPQYAQTLCLCVLKSLSLLLASPSTLRQVQSLEKAVEILQEQFELCDALKIETSNTGKPTSDAQTNAMSLA